MSDESERLCEAEAMDFGGFGTRSCIFKATRTCENGHRLCGTHARGRCHVYGCRARRLSGRPTAAAPIESEDGP